MSMVIFGATEGRGDSASSRKRGMVWKSLFRGRERGLRRH